MSFLIGPIAGGLVAGGVYYGFSNLITTRTTQHQRDIHAISQRLVNASTIVPAPLSASARIPHRPFISLLKEQWNQQTAIAFEKLREWEEKAEEWGTKTLYGRGTREGRDR